jgi:hypothetical protein
MSPFFARRLSVALSLSVLLTLFAGFGAAPARADAYVDLEIGRFHHHDHEIWRRGYWHQGWHDGRRGWWWVAGGLWYYYPAPVYPYPDPYRPPVVIVQNPSAPPAAGPAPTQFWYYCEKPSGYYPYVPTCPTAWREVPAAPTAAPTTPPAPPAAPPAR